MVTIQIKNSATDRVVGRATLSNRGWMDFAGNRGSVQFVPFGPRYWANGRVEREQGHRLIGRCSFSFVR